MTARTVLGLATVGLLVAGVVGWVGGMPQPASSASAGPASLPLAHAGSTRAGAGAHAGVDPAPGQPGTGEGGTGQGGAGESGGAGAARSAMDGVVDAGWLASTAAATGVPARALEAYAGAAVRQKQAGPGCGVAWNTLAAIGTVESGNGTHGGAHLGADGRLVGHIYGPELNGKGYAAVPDSDGGALDGDTAWDRAVGPMQFLPSTWARDGVDGSGDGTADPDNIDDAALSAATYLCEIGGDLTTAAGWQAAIAGYNDNPDYAEQVRAQADLFAHEVDG
ncbi:MAG TPA: lytic transglycosylase domain-containing protein [Gryllotalpicola sp.]